MSRFGYADSFSSKRSAQECAEAARHALSSMGCRPTAGQEGTEIEGKVGMGWAIRLIGGLIAPASWFPVRLSVSIRDGDDGRQVTVRADENFGVGSLMGVEKKMRERCDNLGNQISRLLRTRLD